MTEIFVSIGSNIDKEKNIPSCIRALEKEFGRLCLSSVYETAAEGFAGDNFYNLVASFESNLSAEDLVNKLHQIEQAHGRNRSVKGFSARTLDIDLLLYDNMVSSSPVQLPRNEILKYAFVLKPLAELAGDKLHPLLGESYASLWKSFLVSHQMEDLTPIGAAHGWS